MKWAPVSAVVFVATFSLLTNTAGAAEDAGGDTDPPVLYLPEDIIVPDTGQGGEVVKYDAATGDTSAIASFRCDPNTGSVFRVGTTVVKCTAADSAGNVATGTFQVTVGSAPQVTQPDPVADWRAAAEQARGFKGVRGAARLLRSAERLLGDDIAQNDRAACHKVAAIARMMNRQQARGRVPTDEAQALGEASVALVAHLDCDRRNTL